VACPSFNVNRHESVRDAYPIGRGRLYPIGYASRAETPAFTPWLRRFRAGTHVAVESAPEEAIRLAPTISIRRTTALNSPVIAR